MLMVLIQWFLLLSSYCCKSPTDHGNLCLAKWWRCFWTGYVNEVTYATLGIQPWYLNQVT